MLKYKNTLLLTGLLMFIFGFTSIVMELAGTYWAFLKWLEWGGSLFAFVAKILMVILGILIIVFARTDWEREIKECE